MDDLAWLPVRALDQCVFREPNIRVFRRSPGGGMLITTSWSELGLLCGFPTGTGATKAGVLAGCSDRVVRKWRARWESRPCIESLLDAPRSGRPPRVSLQTRCEIVQLAQGSYGWKLCLMHVPD
jgi:hypothetical protein